MPSWLGPLAGIIFVDLVLSGDNALVIGAAASKLPRRQRLLALLLGGGGAIVLRITLTGIANLLLQVPLLKAFGGVVLLWIAVRLLLADCPPEAEAEDGKKEGGARGKSGFWSAVLAIVVADVTMSIDNILAVGALAAGAFPMLALGLLLSIFGVLLASAVISGLIARLPWLLDLTALILGWTAAEMILSDGRLSPMLSRVSWSSMLLPMMAIVLILVADVARWRKRFLARCNQRAGFETVGEIYERLPRWKQRTCDLVGIIPLLGGGLLQILLTWWR